MLQRMDGFQSSTMEIEATIQNAAVVLCNDKPQTFGAPDVLQVTASQASGQYTMSMFFPDRPPNQAARIGLAISASFLNNSSSRWEAMCESWAVEAELVDTVSPIYRSDHHRLDPHYGCFPAVLQSCSCIPACVQYCSMHIKQACCS